MDTPINGMTMNEIANSESFRALLIAKEFIETVYGLEKNREADLPIDIQFELANVYLEEMLNKLGVDPEAILFGLLSVMQIVCNSRGITVPDILEQIESVIKQVKQD